MKKYISFGNINKKYFVILLVNSLLCDVTYELLLKLLINDEDKVIFKNKKKLLSLLLENMGKILILFGELLILKNEEKDINYKKTESKKESKIIEFIYNAPNKEKYLNLK